MYLCVQVHECVRVLYCARDDPRTLQMLGIPPLSRSPGLTSGSLAVIASQYHFPLHHAWVYPSH